MNYSVTIEPVNVAVNDELGPASKMAGLHLAGAV